ncbi:hypothetical protein OV079_23945 [Nannocystis pusilla]|uniref:Uncharacterized protein n=1 Tax=Nannocystis pusilla TaxID=889268 RepID=A0A9X3IU43_9BACT|nr:hypothetical protein [Nannocystis pusilla]MCY1004031.1 hypothetical protein [Nannocystis pusilla]MCY1008556.1 hypothetical protein [Nannocystis pusilla]
MERDDGEGAKVISLLGCKIERALQESECRRPEISDPVFRASLASVLTIDACCSRQELLDAVVFYVQRSGELRQALEVAAGMLRAGDVDGAERHLVDVRDSLEVDRG